jgi:hypothetical protein
MIRTLNTNENMPGVRKLFYQTSLYEIYSKIAKFSTGWYTYQTKANILEIKLHYYITFGQKNYSTVIKKGLKSV